MESARNENICLIGKGYGQFEGLRCRWKENDEVGLAEINEVGK